MNKKSLIGFVSGVALVGVVSVSAVQQPKTIQSCASLLPEGYTFTINITGKIDTTSNNREFKGDFSLSDGTQDESPELQQTLRPFLECVSQLIK